MTTAQLQHYVPRFLLRRFGSGKKERLHVFDKHTSATFCSAATKLAAMNNFYDFKFMDASMTVEPVLSHVESKAGKHIVNILKRRRLGLDDPIERSELTAFLAIQMVRTPAMSAMHNDISTRLKNWLRDNGASQDFFRSDPAIGDGENAQRAIMARSIVNAPARFGPAFIDKDWLLLQTDSKHPFLIGDHPLTMHNLVKVGGYGNLGIASKGIEIYFPLSPNLALAILCPTHREVLTNDLQSIDRIIGASNKDRNWVGKTDALALLQALNTGEPLQSNPANVEFINSLQIAAAERFVFSSNDDFSLVKEMIHTDPECRHGHRMQEATGKL
jgi:Protein of unknown function (DUF4238)